jgi:glutathione-regulated potassium-efflux system protein KefB
MSALSQVLIFLIAAVLLVPLAKRFGLGSVLGYLVAGVIIGPSGIGLIRDVESVLHLAELGVVLLLFIIGLELQPSRLWAMRRSVFGYGGAQVLATGVLFAGIGGLCGLRAPTAIVAGFGLSLSSTAFVLQLLAEKQQLSTVHGRASFGILLFQDLAVIPLLALLPLMGESTAPSTTPSWSSALRVIGVLLGVIFGGRYLMRPLFRIVARSRSQEVFTATALLVAIGTALLVSTVGMSMALGAFLAGVLLAESEYRHELEADIEPFKGLLLGLFFIAVGMSLRIGLIVERPVITLLLVAGLVVVKAAVLFVLGRLTFRDNQSAASLGVMLSQGGEFAFVLFGLAVTDHIMDRALADLLVVVVGLSMAVTPLLAIVHERFILPRLKPRNQREFEVEPEEDAPVIIAGFGRVGQVVGRVLRAKGIPFTAMDMSSDQIDVVKRYGSKVFYGDASRLDLLRAARADKAKVFVLAIDDVAASLRTAETVLKHFPHLTIFARARNRQHTYQLLGLGVQHVTRETFSSSLEMTVDVLEDLGLSRNEATRTAHRFREHDEAALMESYEFAKDENKLVELSTKARKELAEIFARDAEEERGG